MISLVVTLHIIAFATALGGRILTLPLLREALSAHSSERLEEVQQSLILIRYADAALLLAALSGIGLFLLSGQSLSLSPWSFKLKLIAFGLLFINIGASHIAQARVVNHYDAQMAPVLQTLNLLAVSLMCGMVFFAILR